MSKTTIVTLRLQDRRILPIDVKAAGLQVGSAASELAVKALFGARIANSVRKANGKPVRVRVTCEEVK